MLTALLVDVFALVRRISPNDVFRDLLEGFNLVPGRP